eukprot:Blabericola_migrator_1__2312@NODE_1643_length_4107_cov_132_707921_g1070_i0_p1_GENE_NODE_1643_length_4107_cov_132_707921_g1070_i0NODE_1643_length_4107_cov_132_707921_g1070_i0_p1_ORF_typecomplete_len208_score50_51GST_N/PF02798_20/3_6e13GST_N_3/PF13417_6/2_8e07GST_C_3/PF14497_6/0_00022GST_N_4/PF17172_4/0_044_NODE_1643_length_4107_cov_132_707921_g1070_i0229852
MTPKLVLHYFDGPGRAEPIRCALVAGGLEFEDVRHTREDFQKKIKPISPTGQIPMMEIDGKAFAESRALLEYACALSGNVASDPLELLAHNMIMDRMEDQAKYITPIYMANSEEDRALAIERANIGLKDVLKMVNDLVKNYGGAPNHILKDKPFCPADLFIYCAIRQMNSHLMGIDVGDIATQFPHVQAVYQGVLDSNPKIVAYHSA